MKIWIMLFLALSAPAFAQSEYYHRPQKENSCDAEFLASYRKRTWMMCVVAVTAAQARAYAAVATPCVCGRKGVPVHIRVRRTAKGTGNELSDEQFNCMTGEDAEAGQYIAAVDYQCR